MDWLDIVRTIVDIGIVTLVMYKVFMSSRGTRAMSILKGVGVILIVWFASGLLGLQTVKFITSQALVYGILGLFIVFQPELRQFLERLGKNGLVSKQSFKDEDETSRMIDALVEASKYLSKRKIGALISIEMEDSLQEYANTGIQLDSKISKELLENIFTPNVPLHDGALIIRNNRISSASCYLPLSDRMDISKELGTRHRAAIGLSEVTDALTLVISEETGSVSLTRNSKLYRGISCEELRNHLELSLISPQVKSKSFFSRGFKNERR